MTTLTRDAAIADLQSLVDDEGLAPSRTRYRKEGRYSTFEIETLFGSWSEFKSAAGLIHTRLQRQMLSHVAKHVAHDDLHRFGLDRHEYGEKYLKPTGRRFQTLLVASDIHDKEMDPFWRRVFIDTAKRVQPDVIVLGGDIYDLPEFGKYTIDPREWDVVGRIEFMNEFLRELREACPDSQFDVVEGNHEFRLLRHLGEATPALKAVLSDLHGFTIPKLLGLDEFEINYVARGDLKAWNKGDINKEISKNYKIYFDSFLVHHFPEGEQYGLSGVNGHHHKWLVKSSFSALRGPIIWTQLGCGHRRRAEYCDAEKWNMGFQLVHIDAENTLVNPEYVMISDFAVVGGQYYMRAPHER